MPRISLTVSLVDDENRTLASQNWSPLGYEDLGNPNLAAVEATLVNGAERNLLERLRTSIDRTLLTFARRERRRWAPRSAESHPNRVDAVIDDYTGEYSQIVEDPEFEHIGDIARSSRMVRVPPNSLMELPNPLIELTESQRMAILADQPMVENQRVQEPKKKRVRPVKRVSRYKRDPVI